MLGRTPWAKRCKLLDGGINAREVSEQRTEDVSAGICAVHKHYGDPSWKLLWPVFVRIVSAILTSRKALPPSWMRKPNMPKKISPKAKWWLIVPLDVVNNIH